MNDQESGGVQFRDEVKRLLRSGALLPIIALIVMIAFAYLMFSRFSRFDEQLSSIDTQVETAMAALEAVAQKAENARLVAKEAEREAYEAARARAAAEESKAVAHNQTRRALEQMELARQEADLTREQLARVRRERDQELNRMQQALNQIVSTQRTALGLVMNLGSDTIRFDFDKAALRPENRELLSRIVGVLMTSDHFRVQVYGHTDDIGTEEYNQRLSERRARTVRDYMVEAGIDPEIISTKGFGKSNPLVPGNSPEARATNRRVEVAIIDTYVQYKERAAENEAN
jgi:outer membrane protein OmpA-like peptidoglycan-associated protein